MKKTILTLLLIATISGFTFGQLSFGIKGGLNYSKLAFDDVQNILSQGSEYNLSQDEMFQGFHVGIQTRLKIFSLFIQPELLFNTSGGKISVEKTSGTQVIQEVKSIKYNKIDLPVMVGLKFGPLRVNAGPVASAVLSADSGLGDIIQGIEETSKKATIGFQGGLGLDILKKLTIDARYEGGLISKLGDKITVAGTDYSFDSRNPKFILSVGILF
jgi:hypothetical protein